MKVQTKGVVFACTLTIAGAFAFAGFGNVSASVDQKPVAGASAALASAVSNADAEVTVLENKQAEIVLQESEKNAEAEAEAQAKAEEEAKAQEEARVRAQAEEEERARAQEEAEQSARETQAEVEQIIAEQKYKQTKVLKAADEESIQDDDIEGTVAEGIDWDGNEAAQVVNYATKFVGNPYVWGGTSLTSGTDCSGFTMSVYKEFGKDIPHSSSGQRSVGRAVSVKEMKPGDIVCYSGHVALYCGNDTIVHASNPSTGIKYSNVYYRQILAVRRLF